MSQFYIAFVQGKTNEQTGNGTLAANTKTLAVTNASTYFDPDDLIFVSESGGSNEIEFLGKATSVTTSQIEVTYPVIQAKSSNWEVWKPTNGFQFTQNPQNPIEEDENTQTELSISKSAIAYATETGETLKSRTLQWRDTLRIDDINNFRTFRTALRTLGDLEMTFVDVNRAIQSAQLLTFDAPKRATSELSKFNNYSQPDQEAREAEYNLTVELLIGTEGEYV